jgi:hypothetical protein
MVVTKRFKSRFKRMDKPGRRGRIRWPGKFLAPGGKSHSEKLIKKAFPWTSLGAIQSCEVIINEPPTIQSKDKIQPEANPSTHKFRVVISGSYFGFTSRYTSRQLSNSFRTSIGIVRKGSRTAKFLFFGLLELNINVSSATLNVAICLLTLEWCTYFDLGCT